MGGGFAQIFSQILSVRVKKQRSTNVISSRHVKREKTSLPVDVRRSRTLNPLNTDTIRSLSNDDGDDNENGKKARNLDKQNNNFAHASRSFVHFFAVAA